MARPNYNPQQLRELTQRYQMASYRYATQIMQQLNEMEYAVEEGELDANSAEYQDRKAQLNSLLYLTVRNAMDAQSNISQGYPTRFSSQNIEAMSKRMMQDPAYAEVMKTQPVAVPEEPLLWRNTQHAFRESVDAALGENYRPQPITDDTQPQEDRERRAVVLRQVLKELEATGTGYYVPGISRGRNSREFENVKTEVRRQIAMLEGNMPLSKADDDKMLRTLDAYSANKKSTRTRGFGNDRQKSVLKLYAEYTLHPAPRPENDAPLHTPQEIKEQYNAAKGLNDDIYINHDDYVDFAKTEYTEMPGRTVQQEYQDSVQVLRDLTNLRRTTNQPLTATQQATYREHVLRAAALQNVMVTDPAGPNAKLNGDEIRTLVNAASQTPFVNTAIDQALHSWDHMNELTRAIAGGYRPQMSTAYRRDPDNYANPLLRNFQIIGYRTIAEQLRDAKNQLRDLGFEGQPITMTQSSQIRPLAIKVMALSKLLSESEVNGTEHLSPEALNAAIQAAPDDSEIQRAVDVALTDPVKAQELCEYITGDNTYEEVKDRVEEIAHGGIVNRVQREATRISELPYRNYNTPEERTQAENELIHYAALANVRDAHRDDDEPNPYVDEEEIEAAENALRQDQVFMNSVRGKITNTQELQAAAENLAPVRYETHRFRAQEFIRRIEEDPDDADISKSCLEAEFSAMTAIRNLQRDAGSDNVLITDAQRDEERLKVQLGDAHLGLVRGIEQDGAVLGRQLMANTFNKKGDAFVQAHAQNVAPLRNKYPYPAFGPNSIGAAYEQVKPFFNPAGYEDNLAVNAEGRRQLADHFVRALALRQLTIESEDGAHRRLSQDQLRRTEERIKADPRYAGTLEQIRTDRNFAIKAMNTMKNAIDLNALKARYNRAQGNEFIDPAAGFLARMTASQWAEREKNRLLDAYGRNKQWTPQEKQHLMRAYARMHVMREYSRQAGRADEVLSLTSVNNTANGYLNRPGVKENLDALFADPSTLADHFADNRKREIWLDLNLSDADRVAKLMAVDSLRKQRFSDALISPAELAAEEQKIRDSLSYQQISDYLATGGKLEDIEPEGDVNYFDAMEEKAFNLPGVQAGYENHKKLLTNQLRAMQQQGKQEEMGPVLAELYLVIQCEQDGIPYNQIPSRGEMGHRAASLAQTEDFRNAMNVLKADADELNTLIDGAELGLFGGDMTQLLNGLAAQDRMQNAPDDLREPNILHEARAQVMTDTYRNLVQGNAEDKWASEAEKLARRDDYLRFTAMNRIYAEQPGRVFIPESEINAGVEALKNDPQFMEQMNRHLTSPIHLRQAVFNSAGIQRWDDTKKLEEYRAQLQMAKQAELDGRPESHSFVYGMIADRLANTIEARLSGREISNGYLRARDLNLAVNEVQFSDRYRAIENAIQADVKEYDRVMNLFKLPPDQFKTEYEKLTDEFMEKYPSVPMKDTNTLGHKYNQALEDIRSAAQEDPEAIANDDAKREALAKNIKEVLLDRRIILNAPLDPQLMRRNLNIYDNPNTNKVDEVREQVEEGVDNLLGDLNERLKDPKVVEGYVNALKDTGDLRELAAEEYHSKEVFADPLVRKIREEGLAAPQPGLQNVINNAAAQARIAPEGETPAQREERLQGQIAGILNKALLKDLPEDDVPNSQKQAEQEQFIKDLPDFKRAVKNMANDPQALEAFLNAASTGASGAELAKQLDQNAIAQGKKDDPARDPASNILFYLRKQSMAPSRNGIYANTTGKGMNSWMRGQREIALDHCVRATAVNKLLYENPDRVYFTDAEIEAQYKKVLENKEYIDMLEKGATNGLKLRGEFFGYQGVMAWDQIATAATEADKVYAEPGKNKDSFPGRIYAMTEIMTSKRNGKVTNNEDVGSAEKLALVNEYMQTDEYKLLNEAFIENPDVFKHYVLDVMTVPDAEYEKKHQEFVEKVQLKKMGAAEAGEDDLEIEIDGKKFDIKGNVLHPHLEEQEAPKKQPVPQEQPVVEEGPQEEAQPEAAPEEREPVGWPVFEQDDKPLPTAGDPNSSFNQTRAEVNEILKQPVVDPGKLEEGIGTLYITALLDKTGKPVTEETIEACRGKLAEDKVFQKYVTKCLSDRKFAKGELNNTLFKPDPNAMREMMKLAVNQPVQEAPAAKDTPMAQFKENLKILADGEKARHNAPLDKNHINSLALQVCKTVALYNLAQSPKYKDKPVDNKDLKAEALRLKDDPEMKQSIWAAVNDPNAHKTLVEGMKLSQKDPQTFTNFVQGLGAGPDDAKEWLDATYRPAQPAVQVPVKENEIKQKGPQAGPVPQA
ncbi:MAG: hypothetical protein J6X24_02025 [Firmicutes bacterium]|nr:hypothetical protein [Bacillota bacterium]